MAAAAVDWVAVRSHYFPGAAKHAAYLNSAVAGLMSTDAAAANTAALQSWVDDAAAAVYDTGNLDTARARLAGLLKCSVEEVGLTGHTSDGLNIAAHLLDCEVVAFEDEFSSGPIAFLNRGHAVHMIGAEAVKACSGDLVAALAAALGAAPAAKAAVVSAVSYMDGHLIDIAAAAAACRLHGADLIVDASQAVGALELAPSADGVAFLAAPTYKWMCAGPGLGLLYCSADILKRFPGVAPFAGWFGQEVDVR
jgi:selenocysteine lyase/cysteine desulfurase